MFKKLISVLIIALLLNLSYNVMAVEIHQENKNSDNTQNKFCYKERYSVIIVGKYGSKNQGRESYYYFFTGSAARRFKILNETYGFKSENIYLLVTEVNEEGYEAHPNYLDLKETGKIKNKYNSTTENITMVFSQIIKNIITNQDLLVVDLIGHGGDDNAKYIPIYTDMTGKKIDSNKGVSASDTFFPLESPLNKKSKNKIITFFYNYLKDKVKINMNNQNFSIIEEKDYRLYDWELRDLTFQFNPRRTIFILQPCHSGGFINDLSKPNHVIIAAADEGEVAGDFSGPFNNGITGEADRNPEDGNITISEAFEYVQEFKREYYADIYVLIDDNADKKGSINLNGEDGLISSKIYNFRYELI